MTARAYPARKVAKARLLEHCDAQTPKIMPRVWRARTRRLLRATIREELAAAAERADNAVIDELHANGMTPLADIGDAARAAVLASSGRRKGRK